MLFKSKLNKQAVACLFIASSLLTTVALAQKSVSGQLSYSNKGKVIQVQAKSVIKKGAQANYKESQVSLSLKKQKKNNQGGIIGGGYYNSPNHPQAYPDYNDQYQYGYSDNSDRKTCAVIYSQEYKSGYSMRISSGDTLSDLQNLNKQGSYDHWNNSISSIEVKPGCQLVAYQYKNKNIDLYSGRSMNGFSLVMDNSRHNDYYSRTYDINGYAEDRVSSLSCNCRY